MKRSLRMTRPGVGPTLSIGGVTYRGRALRADQWHPLFARLVELESQPLAKASASQLRERLAFYRRYLRVVFPRQWWAPWRADPVEQVFQQSLSAITDAVAECFHQHIGMSYGENALADAMRLFKREAPAPALPAPAPNRSVVWH